VVPAGVSVGGFTQHKDLVPTILDLARVSGLGARFDGTSLVPMMFGAEDSHESEIYITECTWMRKHGWRTPEWKLIRALEPDFHFKPLVELYNLVLDPGEDRNVADENPDVVALLTNRMNSYIAARERETRRKNPIHHQGDWHGHSGIGPFKTSQQAYDTMHIGDPNQAAKLQSESRS
jgi:arylsulfatase A-like enzyme